MIWLLALYVLIGLFSASSVLYYLNVIMKGSDADLKQKIKFICDRMEKTPFLFATSLFFLCLLFWPIAVYEILRGK